MCAVVGFGPKFTPPLPNCVMPGLNLDPDSEPSAFVRAIAAARLNAPAPELVNLTCTVLLIRLSALYTELAAPITAPLPRSVIVALYTLANRVAAAPALAAAAITCCDPI